MSKPVVLFRADASLRIGSGHVMRCLTLADAMCDLGATCHFICREHRGHLTETIRARGHTVHSLPAAERVVASRGAADLVDHADWLGDTWQADAEQSSKIIADLTPVWLVVDHYALDARWEQEVMPSGCRLLVIDDLADRDHVANLLLDQNLGRSSEDYVGLVPARCRCLIGPRYALLRPGFARLRAASLARRQSRPALGQLLISLGGVDKDNATGRVLDALTTCDLPGDCRISVIMGAAAPWLDNVRAKATGMPWATEVVVDVSDMAQRMAHADLAIGAAGSTSWERCCLGLPTLMVVLADNQRRIAAGLDHAGAAVALGTPDDLSELADRWAAITEPEDLRRMALAGAAIVDGLGIERLCDDLRCRDADRAGYA